MFNVFCNGRTSAFGLVSRESNLETDRSGVHLPSRPSPAVHHPSSLHMRFPLTLLLCIVWMSLLNAQANAQLRQMVVSEVQSTESTEAGFPEYPEEAVLRIQSNVPGLAFDSNMGGIVADRSRPAEGEYVLVIKAYTQIFTVQAPGFMQARFRVANLRPGGSRFYTIEPSDPGGVLLPVNFRVDPQGASLFVNGSQEDPTRPVQLGEGEHRIRVEAAGRRTVNETIVVSRERTLFSYALEMQEVEVVRFRSSPEGATLYIDNIREGVTPLDNFYYPGDYVIRLTLDGYRELERQITVTEGQDNLFELDMERFASLLRLDVEPVDATVRVDGRTIGTLEPLELRPGLVRIDVERDGYYPYTEQVVVEAGQDLLRTIALEPRVGSLQFRVLPVDARVSLTGADGVVNREWTGTDILRDIPVGGYAVTARAEGFAAQSESITIREEEVTRLFIDLRQQPASGQPSTPTNPRPSPSTAGASGSAPPSAQVGSARTTAANSVNNAAPSPSPSPSPSSSSDAGASMRESTPATRPVDGPVRYAEQMPEAIGGLDAIYSRIRYPRNAAANGIEGVVYVEFTVSIRGEVTDAVVLRGIGGGCDEEALRVLRNSSFKPGVTGGQVVPVRMTLPFRFQLSN